MAYYFATFAVILITHETISSVKGQCTVQGCDNGDPLVSIVAEIQQLRVDLFDQLNKQVQNIHELLNASFQEMKNQHDTVNISLQAVGRCHQEHDIYSKQHQGIHDILNKSFQEIKSHHDTVETSLQAVDRRFQEQDIYIKQVQSIHELLNESFQEMKNQHGSVLTSLQTVDRRRLQQHAIDIKQGQCIYELLNESFQEMKNQHGSVISSLQAVDRCFQEHDMIMKVRKQNLWKRANGSCESESQVWDCSDLKASGQNASGVFEVCVGHPLDQICTNAFCDMEADNGASLVFQRRKDGSVNFNRTWADYKQGFGNPNGEFWLGNEMLYLLTSKRNYKLRVDLEDFAGGKRYAEYARFSISSSADYYRLRVSGYSGNAGDSLNYHNGQQFSTEDVDNDVCVGNCARTHGGAWWQGCCSHSTLNGKYYHRYDSVSTNKGIHWYHWDNRMRISLKATEMKLVPVA